MQESMKRNILLSPTKAQTAVPETELMHIANFTRGWPESTECGFSLFFTQKPVLSRTGSGTPSLSYAF